VVLATPRHIPADEKALEVDHVLRRKHGGKDVMENLQALLPDRMPLCYCIKNGGF
jgi:5-methylcytosine-specific restriction endonuclease McrA